MTYPALFGIKLVVIVAVILLAAAFFVVLRGGDSEPTQLPQQPDAVQPTEVIDEEASPTLVAASIPKAVDDPKPNVVDDTDNKRIYVDYSVIGDCTKYRSIIDDYDWPVEIALKVCGAESGGRPEAIGDRNTAYVSCGLMQIRTVPGRPSCEVLSDPAANIDYAYGLWKRSGWFPWAVCKNKVNCEAT